MKLRWINSIWAENKGENCKILVNKKKISCAENNHAFVITYPTKILKCSLKKLRVVLGGTNSNSPGNPKDKKKIAIQFNKISLTRNYNSQLLTNFYELNYAELQICAKLNNELLIKLLETTLRWVWIFPCLKHTILQIHTYQQTDYNYAIYI